MRNALFLFALFLPLSFAQATQAWTCYPGSQHKDDPFLLLEIPNDSDLIQLYLDGEWVRKEGRIPEGMLAGTIRRRPDGKSGFAYFDVAQFFPNPSSQGEGSTLTFSVRWTEGSFISDLYVLFPTATSTTGGLILNSYYCRKQTR